MSTFIMVFNILLIIAVILIIAIVMSSKHSSIPDKYKKAFIIVYCCVLAGSTVFLYFLPEKNLINNNKTNYEITHKASLNNFESLALNGQLNTSGTFIKKGAYSLDYSGKKLTIKGDMSNTILVFEKKAIPDGKIDVTNYVTNCQLYNTVMPDKFTCASVKISQNDLLVDNGLHISININQFDSNFLFNQFCPSSANQKYKDSLSNFYSNIIYIKVPWGIEIGDCSNMQIDMIN